MIPAIALPDGTTDGLSALALFFGLAALGLVLVGLLALLSLVAEMDRDAIEARLQVIHRPLAAAYERRVAPAADAAGQRFDRAWAWAVRPLVKREPVRVEAAEQTPSGRD